MRCSQIASLARGRGRCSAIFSDRSISISTLYVVMLSVGCFTLHCPAGNGSLITAPERGQRSMVAKDVPGGSSPHL